jgi:putative two-component system response regulator
MRALIVDDDPVALALIQNILEESGHEVDVAYNGKEAVEMLRSRGARLLITDWEMPEMNGIELCSVVRAEDFAGYVYIIMITSKDQPQQKITGLYAGADNFIAKPINPAELQVCLKTAERILSLETRDLAMFALAKLAESRDPETGSHIERVQSYARLLAQFLSTTEKYRGTIDGEYVGLIYQTSPLHDIGKVGIPDPVLLKPGKLNPEEMAIMRTHTQLGAQTLEAALQRFPGARFLEIARDIAATHHEKFNGTGYPRGLSSGQIPLSGRIVALADVYDALTSRRVYKKPISHEEAKKIIVSESGAHFDPDVVHAFLQTEEHFIAIKSRLGDLELEAAPALPTQSEAGLMSAMLPHGDKILIVEDDPVQREHLASILRLGGHHIIEAFDGDKALQAFLEHSPRVVISDWILPGSSGIELCQKIRSINDRGYTQFMMVSVLNDKEKVLQAFEAGVDDFLRKPFDAGELLARIRAGLRVVRLHDELARKNLGSSQLNAQLSGLNQRLEKLAITDDLTGLFNRRHAMARLEEQWTLSDRYFRPLTIALLDVDHFKNVNDGFGHAAGDSVLKQVSSVLKDSTRTTDTVCRVGGEEFLIIFPAQCVEEATICAERARATISAQAFNSFGDQIQVTVSIGIASRTAAMSELSELMKQVDQALYAAKQKGRNMICISMPGMPPKQADVSTVCALPPTKSNVA